MIVQQYLMGTWTLMSKGSNIMSQAGNLNVQFKNILHRQEISNLDKLNLKSLQRRMQYLNEVYLQILKEDKLNMESMNTNSI